MRINWLDEVENAGWKSLVEELSQKLAELGWDGDIHQIKEKFGGLRFYIGCGSPEVHALIGEYCDRSFHICERCGQPGQLLVRAGGYWLKTLCDLHAVEFGYSRPAEANDRPITLSFTASCKESNEQ